MSKSISEQPFLASQSSVSEMGSLGGWHHQVRCGDSRTARAVVADLNALQLN